MRFSPRNMDGNMIVSPAVLHGYAAANGWKRVAEIPGRFTSYQIVAGHQQMIVPHRADFADYRDRLSEAVCVLADVEHRDADHVWADLLRPTSDVIRFRLAGPATQDGTVRMSAGLNLFDRAKRALQSAARAEDDPQVFYSRLAIGGADDFISQCRLSAEQGSFVAGIVCPMGDSEQLQTALQVPMFDDLAPLPYTRKVTSRFLRLCSYLINSIDAGRGLAIAEQQDPEMMISANLCEALAGMRPDDATTELYITATWAPLVPPREPLPNEVHIRRDHFPVIHELAYRLRPAAVAQMDTYVGTIVTLHSDVGQTALENTVTIDSTRLRDQKRVRPRIILNREDYLVAADAHILGRPVTVTGTTTMVGNFIYITDYRAFSVLTT